MPVTEKKDYPLARAYLGRVQDAYRQVEQLSQQIANLRMLTTDTSVHLTDMPHADSPDQQKLLTILAEIDELEGTLTDVRAQANVIRLYVGKGISRINNRNTQKVLMRHYCDRITWEAVAAELKWSLASIYRHRNSGLAELEKLLRSDMDHSDCRPVENDTEKIESMLKVC